MKDIIIICVIILVVIILASYIIKCYNKFIQIRNRVKDQEAQINVQLKRRCDLIPNLVETVRGYADFEKSTLEAIVNARSNILESNNVEQANSADFELNRALGRLMAISESYPDLKANTGFLNLQSQLAETEDKIAKARQFYNDTVLKFNKRGIA